LGVHDLGDVASGLIFGLICLYAYIRFERHARISTGIANLSLVQGISVLLAIHLIYGLLYPVHEAHEPAYWFMGMMLGWYVGWSLQARREIALPGPKPVQFIVAGAMAGLCFIAMLVTTRLPARLGLEDGLAAGLSGYAMGVVFGVFVVWALPALVAKLTPQSLTPR
jgi:hypothetical protein